MTWREFVASFEWEQGEHVSLIGTTGCGKTTLALALLPARRHTVVFGTKPADATLDALIARGWTRIRSWSDRPFTRKDRPTRIILWPTFDRMSDVVNHRREFAHALDDMFTEKHWSVFVDEVGYLANDLGLRDPIKLWLKQGRSIKLTLMSATQRPAWVPVETYSEASHLFLWRPTDRRDFDRLADIAGPVDRQELRSAAAALDFKKHETLYVSARTGRLIVTIPPSADSGR